MKNWLNKKKRWGHNDFMEVPLYIGNRNKEFIGFDFKGKYFFRIFFDYKYRENDLSDEGVKSEMERLNRELEEAKKGIDNIGIYSTRDDYKKISEQLDFYNKYLGT
jgi:hypothetical protein